MTGASADESNCGAAAGAAFMSVFTVGATASFNAASACCAESSAFGASGCCSVGVAETCYCAVVSGAADQDAIVKQLVDVLLQYILQLLR